MADEYPFAVLDGEGVALMAGGASVDGGVSRLLGDMRRDAGTANLGHSAGGTDRQPPGRARGVPGEWRSIMSVAAGRSAWPSACATSPSSAAGRGSSRRPWGPRPHCRSQGPDQPLRRDRGPSQVGGERRERGMEARQGIIHDVADLAQGMPRRGPRLKVLIAEKRRARLARPAHDHHHPCRDEGEPCSQFLVEAGLFQRPVRRKPNTGPGCG